MLPSAIRIAIVDDHEVVRQGLARYLAQSSSLMVMGECGSSHELLVLLAQYPVDVVLLDYALSRQDMDGLSLVRLLAARYPHLRILMVSAHESQPIMSKAIELGAAGLFSKAQDLNELQHAIAVVARGQCYWPSHLSAKLAAGPKVTLTAREAEVIRCCLEGLSVTQIAAKYRRSLKTISTQKRSAFKKLGIQFDSELFKYFADQARSQDVS